MRNQIRPSRVVNSYLILWNERATTMKFTWLKFHTTLKVWWGFSSSHIYTSVVSSTIHENSGAHTFTRIIVAFDAKEITFDCWRYCWRGINRKWYVHIIRVCASRLSNGCMYDYSLVSRFKPIIDCTYRGTLSQRCQFSRVGHIPTTSLAYLQWTFIFIRIKERVFMSDDITLHTLPYYQHFLRHSEDDDVDGISHWLRLD